MRLLLLQLALCFSHSLSFVVQPQMRRSVPLSMATRRTDFAYQEMRAKINFLVDRKLPWTKMTLLERNELSNYVRQVANERSSLTGDMTKVLPNTMWKLAYSTTDASESLPPTGSTLSLTFQDEEKAEYILEFGDGGSRLTAESDWVYDAGSQTLAISYQNLTTKLGFLNLGLGGLGMKGRTVQIPTAYLDGKFWFERAGLDDFNVYVRLDEPE